MKSAHWAMASSYAASVCSGRYPLAPRWPITVTSPWACAWAGTGPAPRTLAAPSTASMARVVALRRVMPPASTMRVT